jgi:bifunctional NMN adenylyltransferase/nudix hydrolase
MIKDFNILLFIGRFQPPTHAHLYVVQTALNRSEKVVVGIGSANRPRSLQNPFTVEERVDFFRNCGINEIEEACRNGRLVFEPLDDFLYQDGGWVYNVNNKLQKHNFYHPKIKSGLIGCKKDNSSYYLDLFPKIGSISIQPLNDGSHVYNSTKLRELFFTVPNTASLHAYTTEKIVKRLRYYAGTELYKRYAEEFRFVREYKKSWEAAPFPPTFNTVDALVVCNDHVLLIERGQNPGKGLLALPGGFINQDESLLDAAIRELKEETLLDFSDSALKSCLVKPKAFGDPGRDPRGRTITHVHLFNLGYIRKHLPLPDVNAGDDAAKAMWVEIASLTPKNMLCDHYFIIRNMVG